MFTIDDLADRLGGYLPPDEIQQVKRAFYYAEQATTASGGAPASPTSPTRSRFPTFSPTCTWTIRA